MSSGSTRREPSCERLAVPSALPDGVTIGDLPEGEIEHRSRFVAELFGQLTQTLREFIQSGCPLDEEESVRLELAIGLELRVATFRGAARWRAGQEDAIWQAIGEWRAAMAEGSEDVPAPLKAALWCDTALLAEEEFWGIVRQYAPELRILEVLAAAR